MSHGESCAGVVGAGVGGHKKLRRKRKELDALVPEDKVRRKSSSASHHDLLRSDSEDPEADYSGVAVLGKQVLGGGRQGGVWACLPGACTLLLLLTTLVGVAAAFRLLMLTRRDLDALHARISSVEASSSELPAKFHQSHVRLQELEKNQSALWAAVNQLSTSLDDATKRVEFLETNVKGIQDSLSSAPQLSSLPKDVAVLQASVATFGSTLQDAQNSLKEVKQDHNKLTSDVRDATNAIDRFKEDISQLKNQTMMDRGREGGEVQATLGSSVLDLRDRMDSLTTAVTSINTSLALHINDSSVINHKLETLQEASTGESSNLSQRVSSLEAWHSTTDPALPSHLTNLSIAVASLQDTSSLHAQTIHNLTQNMDVVKGVEKKLEGSQLQLASSVSELKQQLKKVEKKVATIAAAADSPAPPASNETHTRRQRSIQSIDLRPPREARGP